MKSWSSALLGAGIGVVLGYLFGVQRGDLWIGSAIAVTSSVAGYGFLAYPQYRNRRSGHSKFWYILIGVMTPVLVLLTTNSTLVPDGSSIVALLASIWLGGVMAGVALVRESTSDSDNEAPSAPHSSPSD